ncbi:hypothetical protein ACEN8K_45510, partial [Variovorax sp. CT11-76]
MIEPTSIHSPSHPAPTDPASSFPPNVPASPTPSQSLPGSVDAVDLSSCDLEPIRVPGSIQ